MSRPVSTPAYPFPDLTLMDPVDSARLLKTRAQQNKRRRQQRFPTAGVDREVTPSS